MNEMRPRMVIVVLKFNFGLLQISAKIYIILALLQSKSHVIKLNCQMALDIEIKSTLVQK